MPKLVSGKCQASRARDRTRHAPISFEVKFRRSRKPFDATVLVSVVVIEAAPFSSEPRNARVTFSQFHELHPREAIQLVQHILARHE